MRNGMYLSEKAAGEAGKGIIEISTNPMEDSTCLENPKFLYGYYDPEETFGNRSYAKFYGVDAVYIYNESAGGGLGK